jgi:hypothetical protein
MTRATPSGVNRTSVVLRFQPGRDEIVLHGTIADV